MGGVFQTFYTEESAYAKLQNLKVNHLTMLNGINSAKVRQIFRFFSLKTNINMSTWLSCKTCIPPTCWPYPSMHCAGVSARGVSAQGVSAQGGCLPRGSRGCLPGRCIPACNGADTPLWTDRYLWKHNLRKLHLRAIKTMPSKDYQCIKIKPDNFSYFLL